MNNQPDLLTWDQPKANKGHDYGYWPAFLHLTPSDLAGFGNMCGFDGAAGCKDDCLNECGMGGIYKTGEDTNDIQTARFNRTQWFAMDFEGFRERLLQDIRLHIRRAGKAGLIPCFRLNATSDLQWVGRGIIEEFPRYQFYDYSKSPLRGFRVDLPKNYHLTISMYPKMEKHVPDLLARGVNIAPVFRMMPSWDMPKVWRGTRVIDGDTHDLRFRDRPGRFVGLRSKGPARYSQAEYVYEYPNA